MTIEWIEFEGERLLLIDVSNLRDNYGMLLSKELSSLINLVKKEPLKSVLAVADLRNTNLNNNNIMALIRHAPLAAPHFRRSALVIEPNPARSFILDTVGQFVERVPKRFDNLEDAKAWLVHEDVKHSV